MIDININLIMDNLDNNDLDLIRWNVYNITLEYIVDECKRIWPTPKTQREELYKIPSIRNIILSHSDNELSLHIEEISGDKTETANLQKELYSSVKAWLYFNFFQNLSKERKKQLDWIKKLIN